MPEINARILDHNKTIIDDYQAMIDSSQSVDDQSLPVLRRNEQLLVVQNGYSHVAGAIPFDAPSVPTSEAFLYLEGYAGRGSVTRAYVRFVPKTRILRPKFSPPNRLDVYIDENHITQATAHLDRTHRYVSYAEWDNGHVYCYFTGFD